MSEICAVPNHISSFLRKLYKILIILPFSTQGRLFISYNPCLPTEWHLFNLNIVPPHPLDLVVVLVVGSSIDVVPEPEMAVVFEEEPRDPVLLP